MNFNEMKHIKGLDLAAKIRWRIFFEHNPLFVTMQDKYAVKAFAAERGVKTAKLLYVTDNPNTIPFNQLPPNYMIKANHGSNMNILCVDGQLYSFKHGGHLIDGYGKLYEHEQIKEYWLSQEDCIKQCQYWLQHKFSNFEWAYHQMPRKIIVEEIISPNNHHELIDYRLYVFDGNVKAINIGSATYRQNHETLIFDEHWEEIVLTKYRYNRPTTITEKPAHFEEMKKVAQQLGKGVNFLRIDCYETKDGVVLGEITVYPEGIQTMTPSDCPYFNRWLGNHWKLNAWDEFVAYWFHIVYLITLAPLRKFPKLYFSLRKTITRLRT